MLVLLSCKHFLLMVSYHFLKIKNIGKNILHNFYAVNPFFEKSKSILETLFIRVIRSLRPHQ
jgi:hypothetical protein